MSFLNPQGIPEFLLRDYSGSEPTIEDDNDGEGAFDLSVTFEFRDVEYARRLPEQPGDGYQNVGVYSGGGCATLSGHVTMSRGHFSVTN